MLRSFLVPDQTQEPTKPKMHHPGKQCMAEIEWSQHLHKAL
jgi:hypothetical protein